MRSRGIVVDPPALDDLRRNGVTGQAVVIQALMAQKPVGALDEAVLRGVCGSEVVAIDTVVRMPSEHGGGFDTSRLPYPERHL